MFQTAGTGTSGGSGTEASDVTSSAKNKVTIITAVAKHKELSVDAKKGELMESNMDAMEVQLVSLFVSVCVFVCLSVCLCLLFAVYYCLVCS